MRGKTFFSSDFYHIHLTFELAFKSLDHDLRLPTWLPYFAGGKAIFGDMANSYSPYSIDFLITYAIAKVLALDAKFGLVVVNTWRIAVLNVIFAWGCRLFAKECLKQSWSADFVFIITLFSGVFFFPHRPIFVIANFFAPWILCYTTRFFTKPQDLLSTSLGLALSFSLAVFHQFTIQTTLIFPYIFFYVVGLALFGPNRKLLWQNIIGSLKKKRGVLVAGVFAVTLVSALLPHLFSFHYFNTYSQKIRYPNEPVKNMVTKTVYNLSDFIYERFELQKALSLVFAYPETLSRVTDVKEGMPGFIEHNFQYFGVLPALLMLVGLVRSRNPFWAPVVFATSLYILFACLDRSPFFLTAMNWHYPMTRHFTFTLLHLTPLLALLAGMGMELVIEAKIRVKARVWQQVLEFGAMFAALAFLVWRMVSFPAYESATQGFMYTSAFLVIGLLILYRSLCHANPSLRFYLMAAFALIDLVAFNRVEISRVVNSGRRPEPSIYAQSINYDHTLPELDELETFRPFQELSPAAYSIFQIPLYFPKLYRYALIGNRSFYDLMLNSTEEMREQVSGYTQPRLRFAEAGVLDLSQEQTKKFLTAETFASPGSVVFLNSPAAEGPLISPSDVHNYLDGNTPLAREEFSVDDFSKDALSFGNSTEGHFWIDVNPASSQIVNFVRASSNNNEFEIWSIAELMGSQDGAKWEHCGFLTIKDAKTESANTRSWMTLNQKAYRKYRILIRGGDRAKLQNLQSLHLGRRQRNLTLGQLYDHKHKIPLSDFQPAGHSADGKYLLLRYLIPNGVGLTTHPSQLFAYGFNVTRDGVGLQPTWGDDWHSSGLFQVSYKRDGWLTINVPVDSEYPSGALDFSVQTPLPGINVLSYGTDSLKVSTDRAKDGWLYYADTWDPYWTVTVDDQKANLVKANIQFKAVYVPKGRHTVEFSYQPTVFYAFIIFGYVMQFLCLLIWSIDLSIVGRKGYVRA